MFSSVVKMFRRDCLADVAGVPVPAARSIAFMHIPKTSGSAVIAGLIAALEPKTMVGGFDHSLFGAFASFDTLPEDARRQIHATPGTLPANADFIAGHIALSTLRAAYPDARCLTLLREPVSRLLSHWMYWRQYTDEALEYWGDWADQVRQSRRPLAEFLSEPELACQTDNLTMRMLLWPHPLIPPSRFIDPRDDALLAATARLRLRQIDCVEIVEDDRLAERLQLWLGRPFAYERRNETNAIPPAFRAPLHRELTAQAQTLLDTRTRLDRLLWTDIAGRCLPAPAIARLRERTILANVARYGALMAV